MKVFFDLDRTLLDTGYFTEQLWQHLAKDYRFDPILQLEQVKGYYNSDGEYQVWEHMKAAGVPRAAVLSLAKTLSSKSLLHNDAIDALNFARRHHNVAILTLGDTDFQTFKLACLPDLGHITAHIVEAHKREFLSATTGTTLLIDDKDLAGSLPDNVVFVQIDRGSSSDLLKHSPKHYKISNLAMLNQIL